MSCESKLRTLMLGQLLIVLAMTTIQLRTGYVIGPAGEAYAQVSASSEYSSAYRATNLIFHDMTGVNVGSMIESVGGDWASRMSTLLLSGAIRPVPRADLLSRPRCRVSPFIPLPACAVSSRI